MMDIQENRCLLCLSTKENTIDLFSDNGKLLNITEIVRQHFWFEDDEVEGCSHICSECWQSTQSFHEFFESILVAHNNDVTPFIKNEDEIEISSPCFGIPYGEIGIESDQDVASTSYVSTVAYEEESTIKNKTKTEDHSMTRENGSVSGCDRINTVVPHDVTPELSIESKTFNKRLKRKAKKDLKQKIYEQSVRLKAEFDEKIHELFDMKCDLCTYEFIKYSEVRKHYRLQHNIRGYIKCCDRQFKNPCAIRDHIDWHANPKMFSCTSCSKIFSTKRGLDAHKELHEPVINRKHVCEHCSKRFVSSPQLRCHLLQVHSAKNDGIVCPICDKRFNKVTALRRHKKIIHEQPIQFICDICAKVFPTKGGLKQHLMKHDDGARVQCPDCGSWIKDLKRHMTRLHFDTPQTCTVCKCVKASIFSLRNHMAAVHGNPKWHNCIICDKKFKKSISLKEHMASHTGERLYQCPHCEMSCNSNANMYKHRKQQHYDLFLSESKKVSKSPQKIASQHSDNCT